MFKGFRDFLMRGNVVDLAVAVIIGAAFGAITTSLVKDIITPFIAAIVGKPDFSALVLTVGSGKITYGNFLNACINFVLQASAVYFFVVLPIQKLMARLNPPKPVEVTTKACSQCLSDVPLAATRCKFCTQPV